jgi:hypothetical protein
MAPDAFYIPVPSLKGKPGQLMIKVIWLPVLECMAAHTVCNVTFFELPCMHIFVTALAV